MESEVTVRRGTLERVTALEERFDGLSKTIESFAEKIDLLIEQGVQRGRQMGEMRSELTRIKGSVAGLKGDTAVIRRALFLARVGGRLGRFMIWIAPIGAALFVWLGDRWELLVDFVRGSGRSP